MANTHEIMLQKSPTAAETAPSEAEAERFQAIHVRHRSVYRYKNLLQRATHVLRLRPFDDHLQKLVRHELTVPPNAQRRDFEEAFGNLATRLVIDEPHQELEIVADSVVKIKEVDPFASFAPDYRVHLPVAWMPWDRRMLEPYLELAELPEAQLQELYQFVKGMAARNDYDLTETLFDLNLHIHRQFEYAPGTTNLDTTAFEVFELRKGVCQDFAHLFICLARLLYIPARYVCGYVVSNAGSPLGPAHQATHAWVEVYLPNVGWVGFDPTNGTMAATDHVRIARGRHFRDATPINGWLEPGSAHTMEIEVAVTPIAEPHAPAPLHDEHDAGGRA